uniref:Uncharacterized protein n=1 Tax=Rhizophora mucronata TaxID=61149 RepID=A0A2P2PKH3_RHIMU
MIDTLTGMGIAAKLEYQGPKLSSCILLNYWKGGSNFDHVESRPMDALQY